MSKSFKARRALKLRILTPAEFLPGYSKERPVNDRPFLLPDLQILVEASVTIAARIDVDVMKRQPSISVGHFRKFL